MRFISVIVPCYNEENYISAFIESILKQDYQKDHIEVLIIDGISTDKTRGVIKEYSNKYPFIKLLDNKKKVVPYALNYGIRSSIGDVIIRMDVHSEYPSDYFSKLVYHLYNLNADNVGGVWKILPVKKDSLFKSIAIGMSHKFGTGNPKYKSGANSIIETDTVPYGCFKRELFDRIGLFDTDLIRNQDDEFNARIIKNGGKIYLIPDVIISYYARDSVSKMAKMFYQYGLFKPLVNRKLGSPSSFRQFVPFLFVLWMISGGILSFFSASFLLLFILVLFLYLSISFIFSCIEAKYDDDPKLLILLPYIFLVIHTSYGLGYSVGILRFAILREKSTQVNYNR